MASLLTSFKDLIKDKIMQIMFGALTLAFGLMIYSPLSIIMKTTSLNLTQLLITILVAIVSVLWYEIVKLKRKMS